MHSDPFPQIWWVFCSMLHILFYVEKWMTYLNRILLQVNGGHQEAGTLCILYPLSKKGIYILMIYVKILQLCPFNSRWSQQHLDRQMLRVCLSLRCLPLFSQILENLGSLQLQYSIRFNKINWNSSSFFFIVRGRVIFCIYSTHLLAEIGSMATVFRNVRLL